jgi:hypothetical protein
MSDESFAEILPADGCRRRRRFVPFSLRFRPFIGVRDCREMPSLRALCASARANTD